MIDKIIVKCSFDDCDKYRHHKKSDWFEMDKRPKYIAEHYKDNYKISHGVCPEHLAIWKKALKIEKEYKT